jgi:hypothetical protein
MARVTLEPHYKIRKILSERVLRFYLTKHYCFISKPAWTFPTNLFHHIEHSADFLCMPWLTIDPLPSGRPSYLLFDCLVLLEETIAVAKQHTVIPILIVVYFRSNLALGFHRTWDFLSRDWWRILLLQLNNDIVNVCNISIGATLAVLMQQLLVSARSWLINYTYIFMIN